MTRTNARTAKNGCYRAAPWTTGANAAPEPRRFWGDFEKAPRCGNPAPLSHFFAGRSLTSADLLPRTYSAFDRPTLSHIRKILLPSFIGAAAHG